MELGRAYVYRKAQAQQERGGRSYRVVKDMTRHRDGSVTSKTVEAGLTRPKALGLSKALNGLTRE